MACGVRCFLEAGRSRSLTLLAAQGGGLLPVSDAVAGELEATYGLRRIGELEGLFDEIWLVSSERRIENPAAAHLFRHFSVAGVT